MFYIFEANDLPNDTKYFVKKWKNCIETIGKPQPEFCIEHSAQLDSL